MNRRDFLRYSLASTTLAAVYGYEQCTPDPARAANTAGQSSQPLPIPELLSVAEPAAGTAPALLNVAAGSRQFLPGLTTPTLGYNGVFLGPTIRIREGEQFRLKVHNLLDQVTTVHWHGLHVPAQWDGGPHQVIEPGAVWNPAFQIRQQAATLWYHPHAMGLTGEHVYRGLAGMFIIDDEVSDALPLPNSYGTDDIPLILQDRRFFEDGRFAYVHSMHDIIHGVQGTHLLVNGVLRPYIKVGKGVVRFRVLNGSNSSIYRLRLSQGRTMYAIASDGGLLNRPVPVREAVLSAGERLEILIDCGDIPDNERLNLLVDQYGGESHEALSLRITDKPTEITSIPAHLRAQAPLRESPGLRTRTFALETMTGRGMGMMGNNRLTINGRKMEMDRIDEQIQLGSTEIWEITNRSASMMQLPHSMHVHAIQFNILDRNGKAPGPLETGRKDTVLLWPGDKVRIIARFVDYTGIYMYHCHMLEHEDDGMMGQFEVVPDDRLSA